MPDQQDDKKNPIIKYFDGKPIRKKNELKIVLDEHEMERILKISAITSLHPAKIVALSAQPCAVCGNDSIRITIPLALLNGNKQFRKRGFTKNDDSK